MYFAVGPYQWDNCLIFHLFHSFHVGFKHTRLCRWMVYSRATTSEMAERDFLPVVFVCLGVVEGLSLAIAAVLSDG
jgi:hypothetical protein